MSDWVKVVIQGMVQGFTEFLPISSTGHLLVFSVLLDFQQSSSGTFEIFIQIGTLLTVVWYFRHSLLEQVLTVHRDPSVRHLWLMIVIASAPIGILGYTFLDFLTDTIFLPYIVPMMIAVTLISGGVIFLLIESLPEDETETKTRSLEDITIRQAIFIGLAQTLALIPGTSRSGASIGGALLAGLDRKTATTFSFYLSIPVLGGATMVELLSNLDLLTADDLFNLILGAFVAGVMGWITVVWLLRYIANNSFIIFGYYRIISGLVLIVLVSLSIL